ncbi:MAG TPA: hypothetical protein VEK11_09320 [Thermoanaerobaculia bacterium]|nr:hypothetical protein [Thermoanaerobaculia bacterium]
MKRIGFAVLLLTVMSGSAIGAGDILQQLRLSKEDAQRDVVFSFAVGQLGHDALRNAFKKATPEARVALVEQVLVWTKTYTQTPQFEQAYQAFRNDYKPEEPGTEGSAEDLQYAREQYKEAVAEWKREYPATGKEMVRRRLREFLKESADVDYSAKLVRREGKMRFVNETYEDEKSGEWKVCYRAGKEPVEKARTFAKAWLAELEGKK